MFRCLHSSSVTHIKSTVNIEIIKGLLQCDSISQNTIKYFYLAIFMTVNTNIMTETVKRFYINY